MHICVSSFCSFVSKLFSCMKCIFFAICVQLMTSKEMRTVQTQISQTLFCMIFFVTMSLQRFLLTFRWINQSPLIIAFTAQIKRHFTFTWKGLRSKWKKKKKITVKVVLPTRMLNDEMTSKRTLVLLNKDNPFLDNVWIWMIAIQSLIHEKKLK